MFTTVATTTKAATGPITHQLELHSSLLLLRGGGTADGSKKKGKKKKSKRKGKAKKAIVDAMKEKDSAEALGDAIRDRADDLRKEQAAESDPLLQSIDGSVASVGRAMGASDYDAESTSGGVQASPTSVIANYFLKSHGGAHMLQSASSVLATACGLGCLVMVSRFSPSTDAASAGAAIANSKWALALLRRTMIFAFIKHVSGLLASASVAAKAIPKIGISESRKWMEEIVREPVAQYVFYTALVLLWLPTKGFLLAGPAQDDGTFTTIATTWWWPKSRWVVSCFLMGPILLREIVSNMLIASDVLVLWSVGSNNKNGVLERILEVSQSIVNAVMSLLVSPTKWRSADAAKRQEILAGLVSKFSLFLEAGVGGILVVDLAIGLLRMVFGSAVMGGVRPAWHETLTKVVVIRLYIHYLIYIRRKNLSKLATEMRGGALQLPFWVLDSLCDPAKALGISLPAKAAKDDGEDFSVREMFCVGFGLEGTTSSNS